MRGSVVPYIKNSKNGVIIRHKEYLGDINPSQQFQNNIYPINPGLLRTFPWLSQIADAFQEFEFRGLAFTFKSMSSNNVLSDAASTSLGTVMLATEYNADNDGFETKTQMENSEYSNSIKPSNSITHYVECARGQTPLTRLYVRTGEVPVNQDKKFYDLGIFQIATQGMQNTNESPVNNSIGELWVSYEIQFFKPILSENGNVMSAKFTAGPESQQTGASYLTPFANITDPIDGSDQICKLSIGTQVDFYPWIEEGFFKFTYRLYRDPEGDNGAPVIGSMVNCALVACWTSATAGTSSDRISWAPESGAGAFCAEHCWVVKITGSGLNETQSPHFDFQLSAGNASPDSSTFDLTVEKVSHKLYKDFPLTTGCPPYY